MAVRKIERAFGWLAAGWLATGSLPAATLGNGRLEVRIDPSQGCFEVLDARRGEILIRRARIGFAIAPYRELDEVGEGEFETEVGVASFTSEAGRCRVVETERSGALCLASRHPGEGELKVWFELPLGQPRVEIGFSFTNLNDESVRLREVRVIEDATIRPASDTGVLRLLGGGSGPAETTVRRGGKLSAENNALAFFADPERARSLVAGGLTYEDYRKYIP